MTDIEVIRSGELMVAHAQATTEAAIEFVDAWFPTRKGANMTAMDSGRIMLEDDDLPSFIADARGRGLQTEVTEGR